MSAATGRRGFLRGLVSLPLIGGGVTLIGARSTVEQPVTAATLRQYVGFLGREFGEAHDELLRRNPSLSGVAREFIGDRYQFHEFAEPGASAIVAAAAPSTRAALVLSAVGYDWREGIR